MHRRIRIKVDFQKLISHLSREEGRAVTRDQAVQWLSEAGFSHVQGDYWTVVEQDLGQLEPSEVLEIHPLDEDA